MAMYFFDTIECEKVCLDPLGLDLVDIDAAKLMAWTCLSDLLFENSGMIKTRFAVVVGNALRHPVYEVIATGSSY